MVHTRRKNTAVTCARTVQGVNNFNAALCISSHDVDWGMACACHRIINILQRNAKIHQIIKPLGNTQFSLHTHLRRLSAAVLRN